MKRNIQDRKTILCIDDDLNTLSSLKRTLQPLGHRIISTDDSCMGFAYAWLKKPDVIFLDAHMPKIDGYEMLDRLAAEVSLNHIPVIMLSADKRFTKGYYHGCSYYITKPWKNQIVRNIVRYLIEELPEEERMALGIKL